jgi:hypothetical protein
MEKGKGESCGGNPHKLSKNMHTCIGDPYSMVTKYEQLEMLLGISNLGKQISTVPQTLLASFDELLQLEYSI